MPKLLPLLLGALLAIAGGAPAGAFQLVSPDEASAHQNAMRRALKPKPALPPDATTLPWIEIVQPNVNAPIPSPVNIELQFLPAPGATILPDTFRASYGWLGLDITDRIRAHAQITEAGIAVTNAELPSGEHSITLSISDSENHTTERDLSVTVQ